MRVENDLATATLLSRDAEHEMNRPAIIHIAIEPNKQPRLVNRFIYGYTIFAKLG